VGHDYVPSGIEDEVTFGREPLQAFGDLSNPEIPAIG
jgi:hypothetical protein